MAGNRLKAIGYLYLPYLAIVAVTDVVIAFLHHFVFVELLDLPIANSIIFSLLLLIFVLLALYRPVVERVTSNWTDRAEGSPWDIILAIPAMLMLLYESFDWFLILFAFGQFIWFLCLAISNLTLSTAQAYSKLSRPQLFNKIKKDFLKTFAYLIPEKKVVFTPIFGLVLFSIFLLMLLAGVDGFKPSPDTLMPWGAANASFINDPFQQWRFVSAGFIQRGIVQAVGAVVCVVASCRVLEKTIGGKALAIIFLSSLIAANVSWYTFGVGGTIAGSHFAVMGILGAMFMFSLFDIGTDDNRGVFILTALLVGLLVVGLEFMSSELGHDMNIAGLVGGFAGGFVTGICFIPAVRRAKDI